MEHRIHERARSVFDQVSDEVAALLRSTKDWGPSGHRTGQYDVDLRADAICVQRLVAAGFSVLSEESGLTGESSAVVVVDPLDGSTNASRGLPWFATALCLVLDGTPSYATVAVHPTGNRFRAATGLGATRNDEPVRVGGVTELDQALVGVSGAPTHSYGWAQFRALGAAAPDICAVASGALDAWCDMSPDAHGVWDYLAAVLVCTEAGGVAADVMGRDLVVLDPQARRTPVVASTPELLAALLWSRRSSPE